MENILLVKVSISIEVDLDEFSNIKSKSKRLSTNVISRIYQRLRSWYY